jgi:hypothetical protein
MNDYKREITHFINHLQTINSVSELSFEAFMKDTLMDFIQSTDEFCIDNIDQHFYNLIHFVDENMPLEFNNYLHKIAIYPNGREIVNKIFELNDKNEITGSIQDDVDDVDVIPYGYLIFYIIYSEKKEFLNVLLDFDYPLHVRQNYFGNDYFAKDLSPIDFIVHLSRYEPEFYRWLYSLNFHKNKVDFVNKYLDVFVDAIHFAETIGNLEAIEHLNQIIKHKDTECIGCIEEQLNQQGHNVLGGCMYDPEFNF